MVEVAQTHLELRLVQEDQVVGEIFNYHLHQAVQEILRQLVPHKVMVVEMEIVEVVTKVVVAEDLPLQVKQELVVEMVEMV